VRMLRRLCSSDVLLWFADRAAGQAGMGKESRLTSRRE
jgi:hypothetical protein